MPEKMRALWRGATHEDGTPKEYLFGIPAKHLTNDEYEALSAEHKEQVRASGLYEVRAERELAPAAPAASAAPAAPAKKDGE